MTSRGQRPGMLLHICNAQSVPEPSPVKNHPAQNTSSIAVEKSLSTVSPKGKSEFTMYTESKFRFGLEFALLGISFWVILCHLADS